VVIVSHDTRMIGYADRIVHLEDGRIVSDPEKSRTGGAEPLNVPVLVGAMS
jgi:ABC-type bacteriocin/lantibiotic exporter with double-glycine peptidase domain